MRASSGSTASGGYFRGTSNGAYGVGSVYGIVASTTSTGLFATGDIAVDARSTGSRAVAASGGAYAVYGPEAGTAGVRGDSGYVGLWGQGTSYGLFARAVGTSGENYGVLAISDSPSGCAIFSQGNMRVTGTLSKATGSFQIDHPLDPDNRWLSRSFVESPDMLNVYSGNITTDASGAATVQLPDYFEALNRDLRYQLTVIGSDFAQAIISREVSGNTFAIKTDKPRVKVSWQVTGIRQDDYAKTHPIVVETPKSDAERGSRIVAQGGAAPEGIVPTAPTLADPPAPPAMTEPARPAS